QFLLDAGYDKAEVESSVQYVINTERNPELAEQQRIQQLANYIQTQVGRGYDRHVIVNFLIQRGYPYYEVNSAINIIKAPPAEAKIEHKLGLLALVTVILVTVGIGIFYFSAFMEPAVPAKLLDVTTNKLTTIVKPGDELNFQVNIVNLGEIRRYDVVLNYEILEKSTNDVVAQIGETVAISTSTQRVVSVPIPKNAKPGKYLLKAVASYEEFNATSGFLFELLPEAEAVAIEKEVEALIPEEVKEVVPAPELPAPEVPVVAPPVPPTVPAPTPTLPEVTVPKTEEDIFRSKTRAEAIEYVKAISIRDPAKAISLCKSFQYDSQQGQCIIELARFKKDPAYCMNINTTVSRDSCIMQLAVETGDTSACDKISDANIRLGCDILKNSNAQMGKYVPADVKAQLPQVTLTIPAGINVPQQPPTT
ncbi:TPA: hypothetical protein HA265_03100, partial [Candidatus Woesearchaeota archaeon]|nr:hypothetical protein [Candidatus Woesearchaeota archaeon]